MEGGWVKEGEDGGISAEPWFLTHILLHDKAHCDGEYDGDECEDGA